MRIITLSDTLTGIIVILTLYEVYPYQGDCENPTYVINHSTL